MSNSSDAIDVQSQTKEDQEAHTGHPDGEEKSCDPEREPEEVVNPSPGSKSSDGEQEVSSPLVARSEIQDSGADLQAEMEMDDAKNAFRPSKHDVLALLDKLQAENIKLKEESKVTELSRALRKARAEKLELQSKCEAMLRTIDDVVQDSNISQIQARVLQRSNEVNKRSAMQAQESELRYKKQVKELEIQLWRNELLANYWSEKYMRQKWLSRFWERIVTECRIVGDRLKRLIVQNL